MIRYVAYKRVIESGRYILGAEVKAFETESCSLPDQPSSGSFLDCKMLQREHPATFPRFPHPCGVTPPGSLH